MFVYIVLVSGVIGRIEPWGIYTSHARAQCEQRHCQYTYRHHKAGSVFDFETCEIWQYMLDQDQKMYYPSPNP